MSGILMVLSVVGGVGALFCEWIIALRSRRVRATLEQPLAGIAKERERMFRVLFVTSILLLIVSLVLSASSRRSVDPVQGLAVVIATAASHGQNAAAMIPIEKTVATTILQALPGATVSLYELRGASLYRVVPQTIDRVFFQLQLDGVQAGAPSEEVPTMASVQQALIKTYSGVPPWIVILTPQALDSGTSGLDGVANVVVGMENVNCFVMNSGRLIETQHIETMAGIVTNRFHQAREPEGLDATESALLILSTGLAFVCFVIWRHAVVPIHTLGIMVIATCHLMGMSDEEVNADVRQAMELASVEDMEGSQKVLDSLLTTITNPKARQRVLYDQALLSYLSGQDEEALAWLRTDPSLFQGPLRDRSETLEAVVLVRMFLSTTNVQLRMQRQHMVQGWLADHPSADPHIHALMVSALVTPVESDLSGVARTMGWLEASYQDVGSSGVGILTETAFRLWTGVQKDVEKRLTAVWPEHIFSEISHSASEPQPISRLRIWTYLASLDSVEEGISFLLDQASMSANDALAFPDRASVDLDDLHAVASLLAEGSTALPQQEALRLQWLLTGSPEGDVQRAATWYARSILWPVLRSFDRTRIGPLALVLCTEANATMAPPVQEAVAALVASACSFPNTVVKNSFEDVLREVLRLWYEQDPEATLETMVALVVHSSPAWGPRLLSLMAPDMAQASKGNNCASAIANGVGDEIGTYDPALLGRLWQIGKGSPTTKERASTYVGHLIQLYTELIPRFSLSDEGVLRSFLLLFSVQPSMSHALSAPSLFADDSSRRARYDQLLQEWDQSCAQIHERIAEPSTFRIPYVMSEMNRELELLRQLQRLLQESEPAAAPTAPSKSTIAAPVPASISGKEAIRLFQEMDRSDRELIQS